jgi:hypothetical protein
MADLNALIAQGAQFAAPVDPFAQYGKMQQLRVGENQNALAQYQLESAKRTDLKQNALNRAYRDAVNSDTGLIDYGRLSKSLVDSGAGSEIPAVLKQQAEFKEAQDKSAKLQSELLANKLKLLPDAYKMADTPEAYLDLHKSIHADPILGPWLKSTGATPERGFAQIQEAIKTGKFNDLRMGSMQSVAQLLEGMKPQTDIGKLIEARNQLPLNDPNRKLFDKEIEDRGAANRNAQQRLAFDQAKFAWEKANPTKSIQDDGTGLVAVDTRTGTATPVVYGANGIQAAPAAPSVTVDGRSFPGLRVDAPASLAGKQVPGKPKAVPEAYSKQAAGVLNTHSSLQTLIDVTQKFKTSDMADPAKRAEIGQAHAVTLLFAKEMFNLGVLNGGDERIVNSVINNPIDFSSSVIPIEAIRKQARDLQNVVERTNENLSEVYKLPPQKLKRTAPASGDSVDSSNPLLR